MFFFNKVKSKKSIIAIVIYSFILLILLSLSDFVEAHKAYRRPYYLFYTFTEYSFFAFIFWQNIEGHRFKIFMTLASTFFISFQIVYFFTSKPKILDSIPIGIETILVFIYTVYYLFEQFKNPNVQFINRTFSFWLVIGIVIYLSGSFFLYILANEVPFKELMSYWFLTYAFDIIKNIFFAIGIYICAKQFSNKKLNKSIPFLDIDLPPRNN